MKFKTDREKQEWGQLFEKNSMLYSIILDVASFSIREFGIMPMVTEIQRTAEENEAIYGYRKMTVHMFWRGLDLRSWIYTEDQVKKIEEYINDKYFYDFRRPGKKVCLAHNVGAGMHFHFQTHPRTRLK